MNTLLFARRLARSCIGSLALIAALVTTLFVSVVPAQAADQVVTNCSDDSQFSSLLAGGTVTFDCGTALIHLSSTKLISANTTIDGGGKITLSGDNKRQLFVIDGAGSLTLRNIVLTNGFSPGDGGAINNGGALALENSTIRESEAQASGGAIVSYGPMDIVNSVLEGNRAANGGALYPRWSGARTTLVHSVLRNNRAMDTTNGWGGAILAWDGAPVTVQASDIYGNTALAGGGIYHFGNSPLILSDGTRLRENVAEHWGGGILNKSGMAALIDVTLSGNSAAYGGGIENDGMATLTNVTLSGNGATDSGGGLDNWGSAALTNVTLSGNGAIYGGGIENAEWSEVTLLNVTLSGNSATYGGGIDGGRYGRVTVRNTIVVDSPAGGNCSGSVIAHGFNLSSDTTCGFGSGRENVEVLLGPLAYYGGVTQIHLPQAGSPAIDHGADCPALDQRGVARPQGPACDIGAVEVETQVP